MTSIVITGRRTKASQKFMRVEAPVSRSARALSVRGAAGRAGAENRARHGRRSGRSRAGSGCYRVDGLDPGVEVLERLRLVGGAPDVGVGGVGLLRAHPILEAGTFHVLRHLFPAAELVDELLIEPRLVDAERGIREQVMNVLAYRKEPEATDKLIEIARTGTDPQLRRLAINYLPRKNDPRTQKLLLEILDK